MIEGRERRKERKEGEKRGREVGDRKELIGDVQSCDRDREEEKKKKIN
jgi:hypothetical protein